MKLLHKTYRVAAAWLLPAIILGSIYSYFAIKQTIYEETDEFLTYEMQRLLQYHKTYGNLPEFHKIANLIEDLHTESSYFTDTLLLEEADGEYVPHRELHFGITHNNTHFTLVLRQLLPGNDDIMEGALRIVAGFVLPFVALLFVMINYISAKIWQPFYETLLVLKQYKLTAPISKFPNTEIEEFIVMQSAAQQLLLKIQSDFNRTKEFNENASHELQTLLAIIKANAEKLLDTEASSETYLQNIIRTAAKLSQVQKSLLLLSKIGNREFSETQQLNLEEICRRSLGIFSETIGILNLNTLVKTEKCSLEINPGLAEILVNNLIKNAIKHNIPYGNLQIELTPASFLVRNTGLPFEGDPENMLERFVKGENGNLGIGLSIVKQICELYNYKLSYTVSEKKWHSIQINFKNLQES